MARIRITSINKNDAYYSDRDELIGMEGEATDIEHTGNGLFAFIFRGTTKLMYAGIEVLDRRISRNEKNISD